MLRNMNCKKSKRPCWHSTENEHARLGEYRWVYLKDTPTRNEMRRSLSFNVMRSIDASSEGARMWSNHFKENSWITADIYWTMLTVLRLPISLVNEAFGVILLVGVLFCVLGIRKNHTAGVLLIPKEFIVGQFSKINQLPHSASRTNIIKN